MFKQLYFIQNLKCLYLKTSRRQAELCIFKKKFLDLYFPLLKKDIE